MSEFYVDCDHFPALKSSPVARLNAEVEYARLLFKNGRSGLMSNQSEFYEELATINQSCVFFRKQRSVRKSRKGLWDIKNGGPHAQVECRQKRI